MLVYEDQLVVMPLRSQSDSGYDDDDLEESGKATGAAATSTAVPGGGTAARPLGLSLGGAGSPVGGGGPEDAAATVRAAADRMTDALVRAPYIVTLTSMTSSMTGAWGLQGVVVDMAFLYGYFQPTLAILQVPLSRTLSSMRLRCACPCVCTSVCAPCSHVYVSAASIELITRGVVMTVVVAAGTPSNIVHATGSVPPQQMSLRRVPRCRRARTPRDLGRCLVL
jgi:hypothetical protein